AACAARAVSPASAVSTAPGWSAPSARSVSTGPSRVVARVRAAVLIRSRPQSAVERSAYQFRPAGRAQLGQQARAVRLDGAAGGRERGGELGFGVTEGDQVQHLALAP